MIAIFGFAAGLVCGVGIGLMAAQMWQQRQFIFLRRGVRLTDGMKFEFLETDSQLDEATINRLRSEWARKYSGPLKP